MKAYSLSVLVLTMIIFYSCSNDLFEEPFEGNKADNVPIEAESGYNRVIQSPEFEVYDSYCADFISIMRELTNRMSQEVQDELVKLASLYRSDSLKYESLYKYHIDNFLLKEDSIRVKKAYSLLLDARAQFIGNKVLRKDIEKNSKLISTRLAENLISFNKFPVQMLKTRTENGKQKCLDECKEDYTADLNHAYLLMGCASVVNIGACVFSLGLSVPAAAWTQASIFALYNIEERKIEADYERCKRRCD